MKKEKIKIKGHVGTWYVVESAVFNGQVIYLLEHEHYGDDAQHLIIDENKNILADEWEHSFDEYPFWQM